MGDFETGALASVESPVRYHPYCTESLTLARYPGREQCLVGSLTGAVASQKVTEAPKGTLRLIGNQPKSAKV